MLHCPSVIHPRGILASKRRYFKCPVKRNTYLTSMRVSRELQIETSIGGSHICKVWFMYQKNCCSGWWDSLHEEFEPLCMLPNRLEIIGIWPEIIKTNNVQHSS